MNNEASQEPLRYPIGRSSIEVSYSDITTLDVDVIVSSEDTELSMGGGVSAAIRGAGGDVIYREAQNRRPAKLGDVVVTSAGHLAAKQVFHGVVLDWWVGKAMTKADVITSVVRRCLDICNKSGLRSIAFPALATGAAGLEPEQSAASIIVEILRHLGDGSDLERVHIALDPLRRGAVTRRFYLQVQQYLALTEAARRVERAVADVAQFKPHTAHTSVEPDRERLAKVRNALDVGMVRTAAAEFSSKVAPQALEDLTAAFHEIGVKVEEVIGPSRDKSSTRLQAERLNILIEKARIERARLEWEDLQTGATTKEREERRRFYLAQEKMFQDELSALTSTSRELVLSLHGIRTRGQWQKEITRLLNEAGFDHEPIDYGYFSLIRFLWPPARKKRVDAFRDAYQSLGARTAKGQPSLIAHSLGTYIAVKAMTSYQLRFDQVILCGAIVKEDYDWDTAYRNGSVRRVLNDCGRLDIWARAATHAVIDAGQSGVKGFDNPAGGKVINRNHAEFGHSDYFYQKNYVDNWIPFLKGLPPSELAHPAASKTNWRFAATVALLAVLGLLFYLLTR